MYYFTIRQTFDLMFNCIVFYKMYIFIYCTIKTNVKVTFWHLRFITIKEYYN